MLMVPVLLLVVLLLIVVVGVVVVVAIVSDDPVVVVDIIGDCCCCLDGIIWIDHDDMFVSCDEDVVVDDDAVIGVVVDRVVVGMVLL